MIVLSYAMLIIQYVQYDTKYYIELIIHDIKFIISRIHRYNLLPYASNVMGCIMHVHLY